VKFDTRYQKLGDGHAFLSPSKYHWLAYDVEKLKRTYKNHRSAARGSELHDVASKLIRLGVYMPRDKMAFNAYVNDSIGYKMSTEVVLYQSLYCYGTCDAISFDGEYLRIFDLKTGDSGGDMKQLIIYAALFCMHYMINPDAIKFDLRLYHGVSVDKANPEPELVKQTMVRIIESVGVLIEEDNL
jgi:hypothetical protein